MPGTMSEAQWEGAFSKTRERPDYVVFEGYGKIKFNDRMNCYVATFLLGEEARKANNLPQGWNETSLKISDEVNDFLVSELPHFDNRLKRVGIRLRNGIVDDAVVITASSEKEKATSYV